MHPMGDTKKSSCEALRKFQVLPFDRMLVSFFCLCAKRGGHVLSYMLFSVLPCLGDWNYHDTCVNAILFIETITVGEKC